jgi:branched-chain amino acid transport system substrate-binding protein
MRIVHSAVVITTFVATCCANGQYADGTVKIGILSDMSSIYSDIGGPGSVIAAKLAIEDFRPTAKGMKVEIVADMQNKPDVGVSIANT